MKVKIQAKSGSKIININRRKAIREKCLNCSGWQPSQVEACNIRGCHLYDFRSGKGNQNPKTRSKAIRKYCLTCCAGQPSEAAKCTAKDCSLFCYRKIQTDRSIEIKFTPEKGYIEYLFEDNIYHEYNIIASCKLN